ncbi:MAG: hypothetical protein ACM3KR_03130 [Deltaproteobacteria bacterium]
MKNLTVYEKLMEEFSYRCYQYSGDTIKIDVDESGDVPKFVMKSPGLESKLNTIQKSELDGILEKAMEEVIKYKKPDQKVRAYLGWD